MASPGAPTDSGAFPEGMGQQGKRNIIIIGGGIMGCTTAYFLTRHPNYKPSQYQITLLEANAIASGASGKAGGLLGLWAYPECLVPLSYRLHRELAEEHGGAERWGYRRVECGSIRAVVKGVDDDQSKAKVPTSPQPKLDHNQPDPSPPPLPIQNTTTAQDENEDKDWEKLPKQAADASDLLKRSLLPQDLDWIDASLVDSYEEMGSEGRAETAQVHPFLFTTSMAQLAKESGVDIRLGAKVTKISFDKTRVQSVEYEQRQTGETARIEADDSTDVVITAGPWTGRLFPPTRIHGIRAHSVVFDADVSPYAVFTQIQLPAGFMPEHRVRKGQKKRHRTRVDPEVYARPNGEVYACGETDSSIPLPETSDLVQADADQCDDLVAYFGTISPALKAAAVKERNACYIPQHMRFGKEMEPIVGQTSVPGLWVASGHTCWGIQNGPATGYLMAEMLMEGGKASSANIDKLNPERFRV
ncbi:FAD dependent oxidoreductase [Rhypophila decipiens]